MIGILAIFRPQAMSLQFGIAAEKSALPYVISTGVRDVFMGLTVLILVSLQNTEALGLVHLALGVVALSDFKVVGKHGHRQKAYIHLGGALIVVTYGSWLLSLT